MFIQINGSSGSTVQQHYKSDVFIYFFIYLAFNLTRQAIKNIFLFTIVAWQAPQDACKKENGKNGGRKGKSQ